MKKNRTHIIIMVVLLILPGSLAIAGKTLSGDDAKEIFAKGNKLYQEGKYAQAIEQYEEIIQKGRQSGPLYYNMGNTYFKMGKIGKAVLHYERAAQFIPRDHDLRANHRFALSLTRAANKDNKKSFFAIIKDGIVGHFTVNEILMDLYLMLLLAGMLHLLTLYFGWQRKYLRNISIILSFFFLIFMYELIGRIKVRDHLGIVTIAGQARFEPREEATTHFALYEGEKVTILKEVGGWSKIQRPDEKAGWVKSDKVERIMRL